MGYDEKKIHGQTKLTNKYKNGKNEKESKIHVRMPI